MLCINLSTNVMASIHVNNLHKRFDRATTATSVVSANAQQDGPVNALNGVNLDINDGESMVILGSSGSGKSTLLRCIAGLEDYDGQVIYGDGPDAQDMKNVEPKNRGIGIVFQNFALYPHFENKGNLGFFFRVRNRESEIDERVKLTSEMMGIGFDALLDRKPATLSGGQKQRVAIARAICRDPKLLLFDEPLSNLDAKLRTSTRIEIRRLINRFAITTLYVTHDQTEATIMGDRLAIMDRGQVLQVGEYRDVYDHPANAFVAGFLGGPAMNLFDGVIESAGVRAFGGWLQLDEAVRGRVSDGQAVTVGIRPEHLSPGAAPAWLSLPILRIERMQSERVQLCYFEPDTSRSDQIGNPRLIMRIPSEPPFDTGAQIHVGAAPEHIHLFEHATGSHI